MTRYYSAMDVMVYPCVSRRLANLVPPLAPLKPPEAMAMGEVVVASDVGRQGELIRDGHNGHSFPAGSEEALSHFLIKVLKTPRIWSEVIANGSDNVATERTRRAWHATMAFSLACSSTLDVARGRLDGR